MKKFYDILNAEEREHKEEYTEKDEEKKFREILLKYEKLNYEEKEINLKVAEKVASRKIMDISNLSFVDHINQTKKQRNIYVTHQTTTKRCVGIIANDGILVDPQEEIGEQPFICYGIYTLPLLCKNRVGHYFEDHETSDERNANAMQRPRNLKTKSARKLDKLIRAVRTREDENALISAVIPRLDNKKYKKNKFYIEAKKLNLKEAEMPARFFPGFLEILYEDYPNFYKLLKEKMKFLQDAYPDVFYFEDYGEDFLWLRMTRSEFVKGEKDKEIEKTIDQIINELHKEYMDNVHPFLTADIKNYNLGQMRTPEDERFYVDTDGVVDPIWTKIQIFFGRGAIAQPTYYSDKFEGPTLLIELNDELIDINEARKGNFNTKYVDHFVLYPKSKDHFQRDILPLKYIKGIVLETKKKSINNGILENLKKTFTVYPERAIPIYSASGDVVWPKNKK